MELPVDSRRNGSTRTMRRLAEKARALKALLNLGTRTSVRSANAKGKEPESLFPVVISEDEFELVIGIFEQVTHERTGFLHHVRRFPFSCWVV